jgi:hypothetical protein
VGETRVDGVVLVFAVALGLASSLLFGMVPALRASRGDLQSTLREGGRGSGATRDRVRGALVLGEVALAVTLLVGAGLLVRSALYLGTLNPGFDPERAVMGRVSLPAARYSDAGLVKRTFGDLARTLRESPGIEAASVVSQAPMGGGGGENSLLAEGVPEARENFVTARLRMSGPGYLETVGIPIVRGRGFDDRDVAGAGMVMIVSRSLAERLFPEATRWASAWPAATPRPPCAGRPWSGSRATCGRGA